MLILASSTSLFLVFGLRVALTTADRNAAAGRTVIPMLVPMVSVALPFLLPARFSSVLWGVASIPLLASLSLVTYGELHHSLQHPHGLYLAAEWIGLRSGDAPITAALTCLIGIITPALAAWWIWNHCLANFDRWVGRPWSPHRLYQATNFSSSPRSASVRIAKRTWGNASIWSPPK